MFAAVDIRLVNPVTGALSVLEVKAEEKKPGKKPEKFFADDHVQDVGFQDYPLRKLGHTAERVAIVHLTMSGKGALDPRVGSVVRCCDIAIFVPKQCGGFGRSCGKRLPGGDDTPNTGEPFFIEKVPRQCAAV